MYQCIALLTPGSLPPARHSPGFKIPSSRGMEERGREGGREREKLYTHTI